MYELKKIGKVFTSKSVRTGPSSYEKRIYWAAVSTKVEKQCPREPGGVISQKTINLVFFADLENLQCPREPGGVISQKTINLVFFADLENLQFHPSNIL